LIYLKKNILYAYFSTFLIYTAIYANPKRIANFQQAIDVNNTNLLAINVNFHTLDGYINKKYHKLNMNDSHTKDGSGSAEIVAHHWSKALTSAPFFCQKNTKYLLRGYLKIDKFPKGQNIVLSVIPGNHEVYWNVSKGNEWEEILLPFIPKESQEYQAVYPT